MVDLKWEKNGNSFAIDVNLPFGTSATVTLPDGTTQKIYAGKNRLECRL
jgi:hypothetical protein